MTTLMIVGLSAWGIVNAVLSILIARGSRENTRSAERNLAQARELKKVSDMLVELRSRPYEWSDPFIRARTDPSDEE